MPEDLAAYGIAGRLRELIAIKWGTQTALADDYGCPRQAISAMARGETRLGNDLACWLAEEHEVNLNWLFIGEGPRFLTEDQARAVAEEPARYETMDDAALLIELGRRMGLRQRQAEELAEVRERLAEIERRVENG